LILAIIEDKQNIIDFILFETLNSIRYIFNNFGNLVIVYIQIF
jgi:hypothetical protein